MELLRGSTTKCWLERSDPAPQNRFFQQPDWLDGFSFSTIPMTTSSLSTQCQPLCGFWESHIIPPPCRMKTLKDGPCHFCLKIPMQHPKTSPTLSQRYHYTVCQGMILTDLNAASEHLRYSCGSVAGLGSCVEGFTPQADVRDWTQFQTLGSLSVVCSQEPRGGKGWRIWRFGGLRCLWYHYVCI